MGALAGNSYSEALHGERYWGIPLVRRCMGDVTGNSEVGAGEGYGGFPE